MLYTLKNSTYCGCIYPSRWVYLNRACSCLLSVAAVHISMNLVSARGVGLVLNQYHSPTLAVDEMLVLVAVSLASLKRKESAWKEELVFMMMPEGGYHGKNNERQ